VSGIKRIVKTFAIWRLLLFIPLLIGQGIPFRDGYQYTSFLFFTKPDFPISSFLLSPLANFDGIHYLSIAGHGYTDNGRFFPLLPLLIKFFSFGQNGQTVQFISAFLLSNIFFLVSLILLYKIIKEDYQENIAFNTILILMLFPTSFFFVSIYAESLFLVLALLSFYFARKRNWLLASISGILLGLTRPTGLIILPALLVELWQTEKHKAAELIKKSWPLLLIPTGIVGYAYYCFRKWHDLFFFMNAQGLLNNGRETGKIILFPQTIFRYLKILVSVSPSHHELWVALIELLVFIIALTMLIFAVKKRIKPSYLVYSFLGLLIPASTGTFTGLPRYILILFPLFLTAGLVFKKKSLLIYAVISIVLSVIFLALFSRGYYIA